MAKTADEPFTFTLILSGISEITDEVRDALFEAGCGDALLGVRDGIVFLDFDREGPSMATAILSAIADVRNAGIGAEVVSIELDKWGVKPLGES